MKKKMQSDSEKGVQKLINEQKALKQSLTEIWKVADSQEYLIELYDNNPDVAKIILEQYYQWQSIDQYKKAIWFEEDYTNPKIIEKEVTKRAQALEETRLIDKSKQDFVSKLKMSPEETEKFEEAFEERKQLKSFSIDNLEKNLEKAFREISDNPEQLKAIKEQEIIAKSLATWEGSNGSWWKEATKDTLKDEISSFLSKYS